MADPYEAVPYPSAPFTQAHADRLAVLATLFGMTPAPLKRCRVLELACGDGGNLIPMAFGLPASEFVGIDRAAGAIRKGQALAGALGLANIRLEALDLAGALPELGQFDYLICHGLYSWVPPPVQDRILSIAKAHLAPQGVAYVSYNTLPGGHLRLALREMMLFHVRDVEEPGERIAQAQALLKWLAAAQAESDPYGAFLKGEMARSLERRGQFLYHDELAETYAPLYFHEFIGHAARHGLQYLAEASLIELEPREFPKEALERLEELSGEPILREQYLDFLRCRRFRRTLLCHEGVCLNRAPRPQRVSGLYAASQAVAGSTGPGETEEFRGPHGAAMKTAHPMAKAALHCLAETWPQALGFGELLGRVRERASLAARPEDEAALAEILYWACAAGLVELHSHAPCCVPRAGERPTASPLARLQVQHGERVTTLRHAEVSIEGPLERQLLLLLDGTRDRAALLGELREFAKGSGGRHKARGKRQKAEARPMVVDAEALERALEKLARLALLKA